MIKYYNIQDQYLDCKQEIDTRIQEVLASGQYFEGPYKTLLKNFVSLLYNDATVVLTNSGTSALQAALTALYVKPNTRVLLPALTYAATAQAVIAVGAIPTFVDIDDRWLFDINKLDDMYDRYGDEISAVIAVDLYGQGVDIDRLFAWCNKHDIRCIIDAAQSFGLCSERYDQSQADAVCLSFNPLKTLGGIGGGALLSKSIHPTILEAVVQSGKTSVGSNSRVELPGLNLRMDSIQAATVVAKLQYYKDNIGKKSYNCWQYYEAFSQHLDKLDMPKRDAKSWNFYVFTIAPKHPEQVRRALNDAGIEHSTHYRLPLNQEGFVSKYGKQKCTRADLLAGRIISLPCHWHLSSDDIDTVIQTVISSL